MGAKTRGNYPSGWCRWTDCKNRERLCHACVRLGKHYTFYAHDPAKPYPPKPRKSKKLWNHA